MSLDEERKLVENAKNDANAFGALFDAHYPAIFGYILKRVADPAVAQDIVAETFLKGFQNIDRFQWKGMSISNWFYKIATNELRQYFRKNRYAPSSLQQLFETEGFEPISDQDLAEELAVAQDHIQRHHQFLRAQEVVQSLPLKYQEVISLRFVEKKKLHEIALILNKKEGTVKSLLSRGVAPLRAALEPEQTQLKSPIGILDGEGAILIQPPSEI